MDSSKRLLVPVARKLRRQITPQEKSLWFHIRNRQLGGIKFRRQYPIGHFVVDFVSVETKLVIELDGGQHNEFSNKQKDDQRTVWLESQGYIVLRFWDNDISGNLEGVLSKISSTINSLTLALSHK